MRIPSKVILASCLAFCTACSRQPDDVQIVKSIQTLIHKDPAVAGDVKVESAKGFVTLSGNVAGSEQRSHAAEDASGITGVKGVFNYLEIEEPTTPSGRQVAPTRRRSRPENPVSASDALVTVAVAVPPKPAEAVPPAPPASDAPVFTPPPTPKPTLASSPPPTPAPLYSKRVISAGTVLSVRLIDSLDSSQNNAGDTFRARLNAPLRLDGDTVIRDGADVEGRVVDTSSSAGRPVLTLELITLTSDGTVYPLQTLSYDKSANSRGASPQNAGAGGVLGTIIGAMSGGRGGGNRGGQGAKPIRFASDAVLSFKLQEPITVVSGKASGGDVPVLIRKQ